MTSFPERTRAETRSRSRDLLEGRRINDLPDLNDWREVKGFGLSIAAEEDAAGRSISFEELIANSGVFFDDDDLQYKFGERTSNCAVRFREAEPTTTPQPGTDPSSDSVDLRAAEMSELSLASTSPDYLLAISTIADDRRSADTPHATYDEMLLFLEEANDCDTKKRTTRKPRKKVPTPPVQPTPILPKPSAGALSANGVRARLDALRSNRLIDESQHAQASRVIHSADDFILRHLDDALAEVEHNATAANHESSKLALLLDVYKSLNAYLAPINDLQQQIHEKTQLAVTRRSQRRTEDAIKLMREVKSLEHKLAHLRVNLASQAGLSAEPDI